LVYITSCLGLSHKDLVQQEISVAKRLMPSANRPSADKEARAKAERGKSLRPWKVGLAAVTGAAMIGVTGGLAAPLVAGSFGALMGALGLGAMAGYIGAVIGNPFFVGGLFGAYGARMSGRIVHHYTQEVEDFAFIPIRIAPVSNIDDDTPLVQPDPRLRVSICISGWLTTEKDIVNPWRVLGEDSEVFALRWEMKTLLHLGKAFSKLVKHAAWTFTARQIIKQTFLAPVLGVVTPPLVLRKISHLVDNPFGVARNRADKAGQILADALINKVQGERPVTVWKLHPKPQHPFQALTGLSSYVVDRLLPWGESYSFLSIKAC
jgi:hypothetical protein